MEKEAGQFFVYVNGNPVRVNLQIFADFQRFEKKERYYTKGLKLEKFLYDPKKKIAVFIPPRESSLEQMLEQGYEFEDSSLDTMDEKLIREDFLQMLDEALLSLTDEEWMLVQELYYLGKTEREAGESLKIPKSTIHRRKLAILQKLRNFVERFF